MSKTITSSLVAAALVAALLGTVSIAGADEPADTRATTTVGFYLRGTTYTCTGDVACFPPDVIIRCKAGDFATGGAAWTTDNPTVQISVPVSRPWRKNGAARGWVVPSGYGVGPDDTVDAQVICAKQG